MLIRKEAFEVVTFAEKGNFGYSGIRIEPDGSTVATNGHILAKFTPAEAVDGAEYPAIDGCDPAATAALEPFTMPADAARMVRKAIPKRSLPIMEDYAALDTAQTNANGHAVFAVTDLENPQVFRPAKQEGTFPRYEHVMQTGDPVATVHLSPAYLKTACDLALKVSNVKGATVELRLYGPDRPVEIRAKGVNGDVVMVLMPMHA